MTSGCSGRSSSPDSSNTGFLTNGLGCSRSWRAISIKFTSAPFSICPTVFVEVVKDCPKACPPIVNNKPPINKAKHCFFIRFTFCRKLTVLTNSTKKKCVYTSFLMSINLYKSTLLITFIPNPYKDFNRRLKN